MSNNFFLRGSTTTSTVFFSIFGWFLKLVWTTILGEDHGIRKLNCFREILPSLMNFVNSSWHRTSWHIGDRVRREVPWEGRSSFRKTWKKT